jgi:hypothetical protein
MALTPVAGELPNVGLALAGSEGQGVQLFGAERSRRGCSACYRGAISVSGGEGKTMPEWERVPIERGRRVCGMDDGWAYLFAQEPSTARPLIFFLVRTQAQTLTGY